MQRETLGMIETKGLVAAIEAAAPAEKAAPRAAAPKACALTEFVGTAMGHTLGLVIANVDPLLREKMNIDRKHRAIGIVGARTGAGPQIFAADEAVKATNSEVVPIELPRDTEGGGGHGPLILFGAEDVSGAQTRRAASGDAAWHRAWRGGGAVMDLETRLNRVLIDLLSDRIVADLTALHRAGWGFDWTAAPELRKRLGRGLIWPEAQEPVLLARVGLGLVPNTAARRAFAARASGPQAAGAGQAAA